MQSLITTLEGGCSLLIHWWNTFNPTPALLLPATIPHVYVGEGRILIIPPFRLVLVLSTLVYEVGESQLAKSDSISRTVSCTTSKETISNGFLAA